MLTRARIHDLPCLKYIIATTEEEMLQEKAKLQESLGEVYPWVQCEDPKVGMFCTQCKKWGRPPPSAKTRWMTRRIVDWNYATGLLKQ